MTEQLREAPSLPSARQRLRPSVTEIRQSDIRLVTRLLSTSGGVNMGQGICNLPPHPDLLEAAGQAMRTGRNSYTASDGIPELKRAIADKYARHNGMPIAPANVLVTCGASGAYECICRCFLDPGDEVVVFAPVYQYHIRLAQRCGATVRYVYLHRPDWSFSREELEEAFRRRPKLIVFSNPNNPTGKVFSRAELETIAELCQEYDVLAVLDEVYEYMLYDTARHVSLASLPGMAERTFTLSSAGKTFFVTGWRVGWLIAPEDVMGPLSVIADETYVCAPAPLQHAIAFGFGFPEQFFTDIAANFSRRRETLNNALRKAGLEPITAGGSCYTLADCRSLNAADDREAMLQLVKQPGIGSVAGSAFFPDRQNTDWLRFCFALDDSELAQGCERLSSLRQSS